MYSAKNYKESCDKFVIGGELEIKDGAILTGFPKAVNQAVSTATTIAYLKLYFNSLLGKLKAAGLMQADSE